MSAADGDDDDVGDRVQANEVIGPAARRGDEGVRCRLDRGLSAQAAHAFQWASSAPDVVDRRLRLLREAINSTVVGGDRYRYTTGSLVREGLLPAATGGSRGDPAGLRRGRFDGWSEQLVQPVEAARRGAADFGVSLDWYTPERGETEVRRGPLDSGGKGGLGGLADSSRARGGRVPVDPATTAGCAGDGNEIQIGPDRAGR